MLSREDLFRFHQLRLRRVFLKRLRAGGFSCITLADGQKPPAFLRRFCEEYPIALFSSSYDGPYLQSRLTGLIREKICHTVVVHGVLVNLYGLGLLITGEAGIGKTTCGLALAARGHAWVADDLIEVEKKRGILYGHGFGSAARAVAQRGKGIVDMTVVSAISKYLPETPVDLWCELKATQVTPEGGKKRRLMQIPLPFLQVASCGVSGNTPVLIEKWVNTFAAGKELT